MIKETIDYSLEVNESNIEKVLCYQVVNKNTGVVEVETSILPQAIKFLSDLQEGLDIISKSETNGSKPDLSVVSDFPVKH